MLRMRKAVRRSGAIEPYKVHRALGLPHAEHEGYFPATALPFCVHRSSFCIAINDRGPGKRMLAGAGRINHGW